MFGAKFPLPVQKEKVKFGTGLGTIAVNSTVYLESDIKQGELLGSSLAAELGQLTTLLILRPGTLKNLVAHTSAVPGGGQTYTYTVRINAAPTAVTCIITAAVRDASDLVNTAKVVAGDRVTVQAVTSLTAAVTSHNASFEIDSTAKRVPFEGTYCSSGTTNIAAGFTRYLNWLYMRGGGGGIDATVTTNTVSHGCSCKGSYKNLVVYAWGAPGAAQTFIYTVMVNGVASVLTATISGAVDVSAQDLINVVQIDPGDQVAVRVVVSGGGAVTVHSAYIDFEEGDYLAGR